MAFSNHATSPSVSRDPYELDRLAEELATRESDLLHNSHGFVDDEDAADTPELPAYIPLSHNNKYLTAPVFNVEEFLLSRSHTSLPDLRSELRDYLSALKEELVKLINDDYEAFISLSTDLKDEGARLERLKLPLGDLRGQVLESKRALHMIQDAIQEKLTERAVLREQEALLHLLLKISESVTRLESLLLITSPEDNSLQSTGMNGSKIPSHLSNAEDSIDEKSRGNQAKHLARVAAEYMQLLYHTLKARGENCVFVNEVQWRVDRIHSTLSSDLDHLFSATLISLTDSKAESRVSEMEKVKWMADLTECLRTYDLLGLWKDAEDVLRRDVVRSFVKKTVYPGALAAPHSPIIPHTPFHPLEGPESATNSNQHPRTPYTPFTAFVSKQNPQHLPAHPGINSHLPRVHLLEDHDDPLANLYNQILRFVERDLSRIMDIADKVSVKALPSSRVDKGVPLAVVQEDTVKADEKGFRIMANVVWNELGTAIMDEIGNIVFAAGRPNDFRKHYETTQAFLRSLELLAPSMQSIEVMRAHPVYIAFERRWQLPVYFQLRWKEIIGKLEEALATVQIDPSFTKEKNSFVTSQAEAAWTAIFRCWSAEVYIPDLCHRFWRLTLQILSRYKTWLDSCLSAVDYVPKMSAGVASEKINSPSSISLASTSTPSTETSTPESVAADDLILRQYAATIIDVKAMRLNVVSIWRQEISMLLPASPETGEDDLVKAEEALNEALSKLLSLVSPASSHIVTVLTRRCCDALLPVRSIPSQFRAMSNKRNPNEPSYFVPSILRPIKQFFAIGTSEGPGYLLKDSFLESYCTDIFNSVAHRYINYLTAMKKTEESLKRLKKGKKSTYSLFGSTANRDDEGRDEERIRSQMILDVEAFGKDGASLGVKVDTNEAYQTLKEMVYATDDIS